VQEHGGEVGVESQPGHGAKLSIELPALSAAALDFTQAEQATAPFAVAVVPVPRAVRPTGLLEQILVVEDEPRCRN